MPENDSPTPAPEAAQQQATPAPPSEAPNVDDMLSAMPGFDQYFGEEQKKSEETPDEAPAASAESEVTSEGEQVGTEEPVEGSEEREKESSPLQKRIDKLTAQKHEALERAETAEAKLKELEARAQGLPVLAPTRAHPLSHVNTLPELEQKLIDARRVKTWALENLDGGQVQQGEGVQDLDGREVKKLLATAEDLITQFIPERLKYLENRSAYDVEAQKHYPNFFKTNTEEYLTLKKWIELIPEVTKFPDFRLIIADAMAGQKMRMQKNNAKNGVPQKASPLAAPQPSSAPRTPTKSVLSQELLGRIANDRRALDIFSESLIGTGGGSKK